MDWLDLLAVQGTLKSLLQHHSSKASILQCSAFFTVQLSHSYTTTGKIIALTRWTSAGKVMSLFFNMLSAKSVQSCLTLCDPMDCSPPGSSVHGIFQARILEWVAIPFSRDLPDPGIEPGSPALHTDSLPFEPPGKLSVREPQWEAW